MVLSKVINLEFSGYWVPEAVLFYPFSRLANLYEPDVLMALQKSFFVEPVALQLTLRDGMVSESFKLPLRRRILSNRKIFEINDLIIYDARHVFNDNIAHLVQYHFSALKIIIDEIGFPLSGIVVLLNTSKSKLAENFFKYFKH